MLQRGVLVANVSSGVARFSNSIEFENGSAAPAIAGGPEGLSDLGSCWVLPASDTLRFKFQLPSECTDVRFVIWVVGSDVGTTKFEVSCSGAEIDAEFNGPIASNRATYETAGAPMSAGSHTVQIRCTLGMIGVQCVKIMFIRKNDDSLNHQGIRLLAPAVEGTVLPKSTRKVRMRWIQSEHLTAEEGKALFVKLGHTDSSGRILPVPGALALPPSGTFVWERRTPFDVTVDPANRIVCEPFMAYDEPTGRITGIQSYNAVISPDGRKVIWTHAPSTQTVTCLTIDESEEVEMSTDDELSQARDCIWSPDSRHVFVNYTSSSSAEAFHYALWDPATGQRLRKYPLANDLYVPICFLPAGDAVLVKNSSATKLSKFNLTTGEASVVYAAAGERTVWNPTVSPDGMLAVFSERKGYIEGGYGLFDTVCFNPLTGAILWRKEDYLSRSETFTPDSKLLLLAHEFIRPPAVEPLGIIPSGVCRFERFAATSGAMDTEFAETFLDVRLTYLPDGQHVLTYGIAGAEPAPTNSLTGVLQCRLASTLEPVATIDLPEHSYLRTFDVPTTGRVVLALLDVGEFPEIDGGLYRWRIPV